MVAIVDCLMHLDAHDFRALRVIEVKARILEIKRRLVT